MSWRVELFVRVGGDMQAMIGSTDYPDSVPDLLRAAARAWETGRVSSLSAVAAAGNGSFTKNATS